MLRRRIPTSLWFVARRAAGDAGRPIVIAQPDHPVSQVFADIAAKVIEAVRIEHDATAPPTIIG